MTTTTWLGSKIAQIASLTEHDGGGKDTTKIDSNAEFACLSKLLANCTEANDKKFVSTKMQDYLNGSAKVHFENEDGTSYDEVTDSTGNRMYVSYDVKGNIAQINTTYKDENGVEQPTKEPLTVSENKGSATEEANVNKESFIKKHCNNVKQFYSDLTSKGVKEAYTSYWGNLF